MVTQFWSSLLTNIAYSDPFQDDPQNDFTTSKQPGFGGGWLEYTYVRIYYGGLGTHYSFGLQGSNGKYFVWLSFGMGAWN